MDRDAEASFDQWIQHAAHYFGLVNSGGAVVALSFMGASHKVPVIGVSALLFFVAGIVVAGLVIMGQLSAAWRVFLNPSGALDPAGIEHAVQKKWTTRWADKVEGRSATFLWTALGLFILGSISGCLALLFS